MRGGWGISVGISVLVNREDRREMCLDALGGIKLALVERLGKNVHMKSYQILSEKARHWPPAPWRMNQLLI